VRCRLDPQPRRVGSKLDRRLSTFAFRVGRNRLLVSGGLRPQCSSSTGDTSINPAVGGIEKNQEKAGMN
jgi:hypothetical protein